MLGPVDKPENQALRDVGARELAVLLPLVAGMVWLGLYPKPVLDRMQPSARAYIERATAGLQAPKSPDFQAVVPHREARP